MISRIIMGLIHCVFIAFFLNEMILTFEIIILKTMRKKVKNKNDKLRLKVGMSIMLFWSITIYLLTVEFIRVMSK